MNISLRQIRAFLAVAELGSFTQAAERLGSSQPALSLLIRQLESDLDLRLFDRTRRRTVITASGREFEQAVAKVIADLDAAVTGARDLASDRLLKLGCRRRPRSEESKRRRELCKVRHKASEIGFFNTLMCEFNFPDLPEADLMRSIRLFGEEVIPALRSYEPF